MSVFGFDLNVPTMALGAITGMTYGILAVGLVLVYRSNRIVNFAHGEIGAFGGTILALAVVRWRFPYWGAIPLALAASAAVAAVAEFAVVRRLRNAPALVSVVATLGVAMFLSLLALVINNEVRAGYTYPQPPGMPEFNIGALRVTRAYSGMLILAPLVVVVLVLFLRFTSAGLGIRASADNPPAARLSGVHANRMSTLSWVIAGMIAAVTAVLIFPTRSVGTGQLLGPGLLVRALVPAVIARMTSLPVALGAGIAVGIVEQELLWNYPQGGFVEMVLFLTVLVALLVRARPEGREEVLGSWAAVQAWPPLPDALRGVWRVRHLGRIVFGIGTVVAVVVGATTSNATAVLIAVIFASALVGLSIGIITGLAGQLSLGQFALAGIGAVVSYAITSRYGNFLAGFVAAGFAAAVASVLIGLPALRIRGLMLAVTTLAFARAAETWLYQQPWMLGDGVDPGRPVIGSFAVSTGRRYYFFALALLVFAFWLAANTWRGGFARKLVALRDNEDGARAFSVRVTRTKLQAFALSGFVAGIGGAVYGHALSRLTASTFPVAGSINVVAMAALGGIGLLAGPLIGAFYIIGVPQFVPLDSAGLAATSLGWLLVILYFPGGLAQVARPARAWLLSLLGRTAVEEQPAADTTFLQAALTHAPQDVSAADEPVLEAKNLRKRYGGVAAVDGVDIAVQRGETLGLIGPNGAGKTTLFELLGGFTKADEGSVVFEGRDVSNANAETRARMGLVRSFQDAALFPTMTVLDAVKLSLERSAPTHFLPSVLGARKSERARDTRSRELVDFMGLGEFRHKQIRELSTGTRRITELACLVALEPTVLLLDEPSSGIAQRETEALRDLLVRLKGFLGTTLVVIEHDMPLVMALSGRIVALESGKVIAQGTPDEIRNDPVVVESYLGTDAKAIQRSGARA